MTREELLAAVCAKMPNLERAQIPVRDYITLRLKSPEELIPTVSLLKESLGFDYLEMITTVDWLGPVNPKGYIANPNPNVFLPEGAVPQNFPGATPNVGYRPTFDMLWTLANLKEKAWVFLRLEIPRDNPDVPSLAGLFQAADWQERETFDLMGVRFEGHPNLVKILTPDFIQGHPLRKDYVHVKDKYDED
ncbi:MAG: NADH-quinone oxidoreductase subunit C [Elusimicrobia bacterium]|nr:NADH-quinone oxidoreductase subunit C [Elusimicrobiota bacterium]